MTDNKNVIPNGLLASKMRNRMEDKNTLDQKGLMYAGTGVISSENGAAVTTSTPPPSENSLLVKDDEQDGGLGWKNVGDVIRSAKTAGQIINANMADSSSIANRASDSDFSHFVHTDENNGVLANNNINFIFPKKYKDQSAPLTLYFNGQTLYDKESYTPDYPLDLKIDELNAKVEKIVFCDGSGDAKAKASIEAAEVRAESVSAKTFDGNLNGVANQATYTASNTSETIESRLTRLGFKQAQFQLYNAGSVRLKKLGNFVICDEVINRTLGGGLTNLDNVTLFTITNSEFIPVQAKMFSFWAADNSNQRVAYGTARINPIGSDGPGKCVVTSQTLYLSGSVLQRISFSFGYDVTYGTY